MTIEQDDWPSSLRSMWSQWAPPASDAVVEQVAAIVDGLVHVVASLYRDEPGFDERCREYVEATLQVGRPGWAAAGRAVWAMWLWRHGDEDSAHVQMVLAELELQRETREPQPDPVGGPSAVGAASNNLGMAYSTMRMFELAQRHLSVAARVSEEEYGPELKLQILADLSNLTELEARWALHAESVGRPNEGRQRAQRALINGRRFEAEAVAQDRADAQAYAQALILGARSVIEPDSLTVTDRRTLQQIVAGPVFGDDPGAVVAWSVLARVSRLTGDVSACHEAARQAAALAATGDHTMIAVALREAALLERPSDFTWQYARAIAGQAEAARLRTVAAFRSRLVLAGLERRYERVSADRRRLQERLQEAARGEAALRHAATHDGLTGLPNRALFGQRLDTGLAACARGEVDVAVAFIDLDDLKGINDEHGHQAGDQVLRWVADTLSASRPDGATVARISGDEFAVLVVGTPGADVVREWAERINDDLGDAKAAASGPAAVRVSVGVCLVPIGVRVDSEEVIRHADEQMYACKRAGKGRAQITVLNEPH